MIDADAARSRPVRVFISYSKEHPEHAAAVRDLWIFLRQKGIDAKLDLPDADRRQDWPVWMQQQIEDADYILVIASPEYRRRAEQGHSTDVGRGANYEAALLRELVYADRHRWFGRILPVILPGEGVEDIPAFLGPFSGGSYRVRDFTVPGAAKLLRVLTARPEFPEPELGDGDLDLPVYDTGTISGDLGRTAARRGRAPEASAKHHHPGARFPVPANTVRPVGEASGTQVLFLGASPFDIAQRRLRADREYQAIRQVARPGSLVLSARTLSAAYDFGDLVDERPDILHICGRFRPADRTLLLEHPVAEPYPAPIERLVQRLGLAQEYGRPVPRLLVFSVGDSAEFAGEFAGLVPVIVGWDGEISEVCARSFAVRCYGAIAGGAVDLVGAVRLAARDIAQSESGCTTFADQLALFGR